MRRVIPIAALFLMALLVVPDLAAAQNYTFTVNGLLGVGGSVDNTDPGFGNLNWQLSYSNAIQKRTHFGVRVGGINFGSNDQLGDLTGPELLYVTLAGEYRERASTGSGRFIESGVFLGLGYYTLDGRLEDGTTDSQGALGLTVGVTGDIPLSRRRNLALRMELQGQLTALDAANFFAMGQIGLSYRF